MFLNYFIVLFLRILLNAGKLGHGGEENISIPCYIPTLESIDVAHISAGCEHSAIITTAGVMYTWGHGGNICA